jgi:hypothetical protein
MDQTQEPLNAVPVCNPTGNVDSPVSVMMTNYLKAGTLPTPKMLHMPNTYCKWTMSNVTAV